MITITIEQTGKETEVYYCAALALSVLRGDDITAKIAVEDHVETESLMCMLGAAENAAKITAITAAGRIARLIAKRIMRKRMHEES